MNIMDLEEADGLTIEMVHAFLQRNGWTRATLEGIEPARWARGDEMRRGLPTLAERSARVHLAQDSLGASLLDTDETSHRVRKHACS